MFGRCVLLSGLILVAMPTQAARTARVITDGAIVYRQPDFDAKVIGYFRAGQQVQVSSRKFSTAFFRVRFKQGVVGYISDIDVEAAASASIPDKPEDKAKAEQARKKAAERKRPMTAKTYLGLMGGYTGYSEIINKIEYKDKLVTYGAKFTFPFDATFLIDFNAIGTFSSPQFYRELSTIEPKGYLFLFSSIFNYPLFDFSARKGLFYIGGGPVIAMSSYVVEVRGSKLDLTEVRMGGVFDLGIAFDLGGALFKLEPKFYVEKASYNSIDIALQFAL